MLHKWQSYRKFQNIYEKRAISYQFTLESTVSKRWRPSASIRCWSDFQCRFSAHHVLYNIRDSSASKKKKSYRLKAQGTFISSCAIISLWGILIEPVGFQTSLPLLGRSKGAKHRRNHGCTRRNKPKIKQIFSTVLLLTAALTGVIPGQIFRTTLIPSGTHFEKFIHN